ncbi:quinone oxidoreductase family protein [Bacillus weihaiensis]|uniref:Alcohol dehydrogenase n=1 Tax=Bacillus weihaiensis TaxID=1547283 RepID=A0A1L3MT36_9BACI|nr:quinone oxidoreductase [Bacillus weihaiensis]APH05503.1 alcohol dehydrogenase [Bacillus weihaiensis]
MKAIQFTEYGGPDVLKIVEIDKPSPRGYEVVIKIEAIGVNYADTARREGQYVVKTPLPYVPGSEVAGTVTEVGKDVKDFSIGDKVVTLLGSNRATGYAEYTIADARGLLLIPDGMNIHQAVALPLQGLSAYHILKTMGRLEEGETVLVHAAAGGVGTIAVQLAKLFGAKKVIATASTDEKLALAKELGADICINYTHDNWEQQVFEATNSKGVDVALEMAGGEIFRKTVECLAPFGRLVIYGVASGEQARLYPSSLMADNKTVTGFFLPGIMKKQELYRKSLQDLLTFLNKGELKLMIGGIFSLEEASKVHELLQGRKTTGKLILKP